MVLAASLAGCATTSAPEHQSQTDPDTNIAAFSSFGWKTATAEGVGDEPMRMLDVNIRNAIVAELMRRGYKETDASPQFLVTYETAAADKVKSNPVRVGVGFGSWGSSMGGSVNVGSPSVQSYREGKLVIHAIDAAANKEVWYGTVSGRVDKARLDADAVARVVAIAMQDFPTRTTGP
jgi:hypothetical protein